mgnify:CR=1 FL=1
MNKSIKTVSSKISRTKSRPFTVSLIEDNQLYLKGIVRKIKNSIPNIKLSAFSRSATFLGSLRHKPEIAIVDFNLDHRSEMEGIELIRELKSKSPNTKIIVLTSDGSISNAVRCINEGAINYVIKEEKAIDKIAEEIKSLMAVIIKDLEREAISKRIHLAIGAVAIVAIGLLAINSLDPNLLE